MFITLSLTAIIEHIKHCYLHMWNLWQTNFFERLRPPLTRHKGPFAALKSRHQPEQAQKGLEHFDPVKLIVTMDIPDVDPRAHLYGFAREETAWRRPQSRFASWVNGSKVLFTSKTKRLMAAINGKSSKRSMKKVNRRHSEGSE